METRDASVRLWFEEFLALYHPAELEIARLYAFDYKRLSEVGREEVKPLDDSIAFGWESDFLLNAIAVVFLLFAEKVAEDCYEISKAKLGVLLRKERGRLKDEAVKTLRRSRKESDFETAAEDLLRALDHFLSEGEVTFPMGLHGIQDGQDERTRKVVKILFLCSHPTDTAPLRHDREAREIRAAIRDAKYPDTFEIEQRWAVRVSELQGLVLGSEARIVHFSGHGTPDSQILVERDHGGAHPVPADALTRLFALLAGRVQCVVLACCHSEDQARAIAEHVGCVIGISGDMGDAAATRFSAAFYQALANGVDIRLAFDLGCNQLALEGRSVAPRLFGEATAASVRFVSGKE